MDQLDRLFHQVVRALAARGTEQLDQPVQVAELYQDLVPYRQIRSALRFETYQDYDVQYAYVTTNAGTLIVWRRGRAMTSAISPIRYHVRFFIA